MLTGRLRPPARGRSDWYSKCTHDVLGIDLQVLTDGKTGVYLDIFVIPKDSSTNTD